MMLAIEYGCRFTVWKTFYEERDGLQDAQQKPSVSAEKSHSADRLGKGAKQDPFLPKQTAPVELIEVEMPGASAPARPASMPSYLELK
jgi:hypothetical protein